MVNKRIQTLLAQLRQQGIRDERLLKAIENVPRERFVDEALAHKAYENTALPIGFGADDFSTLYGRPHDRAC
ncbi:Protein-L-isoaspartate O-methyltransferase [Serratia fonticola]|uniref:Protein-L-isoaspartate O-methyltransferase n=1 Tax=Serratia fonticola TaxID=47917 RepID=A0A4U9WHY0_SERFO|nr:Protein-L-isoaspartate O-methyltransferase [Serratia fonticola]